MNWKVIIPIIILIILLSLAGYYYHGQLVDRVENKIDGWLEDKFAVTVSYDQIRFWPLNKLVIDELELYYKDEQIFSTTRIKCRYQISDLIQNINNLEPGTFMKSVNYIEVYQPFISTDYQQLKELISPERKGDLFHQLAGINLYLEKGQALYQHQDNKLKIKNFAGEVNFTGKGFELASHFDLDTDYLKYKTVEINDLNLEDLKLKYSYNENNWEGSLDSKWIPLSPFQKILTEEVLPATLNTKELKGETRLAIRASGDGIELKDYQGQMDMRTGQVLISNPDWQKGVHLQNTSGCLKIDSSDRSLIVEELDFVLDQVPYYFQGYLDLSQRQKGIFGNLTTSEFNLAHLSNFQPQLEEYDLNGTGQLDLTVSGNLSRPILSLDFYLAQGQLKGEDLSQGQLRLRYQGNTIYIDQFEIMCNQDNRLMAEGLYKLDEEKYNLSLIGQRISPQLLIRHLPAGFRENSNLDDLLKKEGGKLEFDFSLSGQGMRLSTLDLSGEVNYSSPRIKNLKGELWLADEVMIIDNGSLSTGSEGFDFAGEVDFKEQLVDIKGKGKELNLASLQGRFSDLLPQDIPEVAGKAKISTTIEGDLSQPHLQGEVLIKEGVAAGYYFDQLETDLNYQNRELGIKNLKVIRDKATVNGEGTMDFSSLSPEINGDLSVSALPIDYLTRFFTRPLPLKGSLNGELMVEGSLSKPSIEGSVTSQDLKLLSEGINYELNRIEMEFSRPEMGPLYLDYLKVNSKDKARLLARGIINKDDLDLDFLLSDVQLNKLDLMDNISGILNIAGNIEGDFNKPGLDGSLEVSNLVYEDNRLNDISGGFEYRDNNLLLSDIKWQHGQGLYRLEGRVNHLLDNPKLDLSLNTNNGELDRILSLLDINLPEALDYSLKGEAYLSGALDRLRASLDFQAFDNKGEQIMVVSGQIDDSYDLHFQGEGLQLTELLSEIDTGLGLAGKLDFTGEMKGDLTDYNMTLETNIREASVSGFPLAQMGGKFSYQLGEDLKLEQRVKPESGGELAVVGSIKPLQERLKLEIISDNLPLQLFKDTVNIVNRAKGNAAGRIRVGGTFDQPQLSGQMTITGEVFDPGFPHQFSDFKGDLKFVSDHIKVENITGDYGQGSFEIGGRIFPFAQQDNWDMKLSGQNLPFSHGSFTGKFDTEGVKMTGSWREPFFSGDLTPHHFLVEMPFSWPTEDGDSSFAPELELTLNPGKEVYFRRQQNIDVLIEEGNLTLSFQDQEFEMEGELKSKQGDFDFYNNKFILKEARADFNRFQDYIPTIHARAQTVVDGVQITVRLDGPADNMITTFTSQPDLPRREIMALLTQKGGLGEVFKTDEERTRSELVAKMVQKELLRILQNAFQTDFVSELEGKLENVFYLDRMEIDTYELGWNDEISVRLGKSLTDRFYLEYIGTITTDEVESEVSFSYSLDEQTKLEGTWLENDEYRLSIDTTLDF